MESLSFWCFWSVLPGLGLQAEAYNVFSFCLPHFTQLLRNSSVLFWLTAFHSFLLPDPSKMFIYIILDITSRLVVLQVMLLRTVLYMSIPVHVSTVLWGSYCFQNDSVDSAHERPRHSRAWPILGLAILFFLNLTHVIMQRHLIVVFIVFSRLIIKLDIVFTFIWPLG